MQGFNVSSERTEDGKYIVELPSAFKVAVAAKSEDQAIRSAVAYNNNLKESQQKDKLTYQDVLAYDQNFTNIYRNFLKEKEPESVKEDWFQDDQLITERFVNDMRWRDNNSVSMARRVSYSYGGNISDEQKLRLAYLYNTWDAMPAFHETGGAGISGLISNVGKAAADPLNVVGGPLALVGKLFARGVVKAGAGLALREVGSQPVKQKLKSSTSRKIIESAIAGGGADGGISAAFSLADQVDRYNIDMISEIDYGRVLQDAAIGTVSGAGFNAAVAGATRVGPMKKLNESQKLIKQARAIASREMTTHAGLGDRASQIGQQLQATKTAQKVIAEEKVSVIKQELGKIYDFDPKDYGTFFAEDPNAAKEINEFFDVILNTDIEPGRFDDDVSSKFRLEGEEFIVEPTLARKKLANNPKLKQAIEDLDSIGSDFRTELTKSKGVLTGDIRTVYLNNGNGHLVRHWKAMNDPLGNLERVKKLQESNDKIYTDGLQYIKKQLDKYGLNYTKMDADAILHLIAEGKTKQAIKLQTGDDTGLTVKQLLRSMEVGTGKKEDYDFMENGILDILDDLADAENIREKGGRITGKKEMTPAITRRKEIPDAIKGILGESNDPIERILRTQENLASLAYMSDFSNKMTYEFIASGQIDNSLVGKDVGFKTKSLSDIGVDSSALKIMDEYKNLSSADLEVKFNSIKDKTLVQAVQDGDIKNAEGLEIVLKHNEKAADLAYTRIKDKTDKNAAESGVYNPLAQILVSKEYREAVDQVIHGARFKTQDKTLISAGSLLMRGNVFAQIMKTAWSPITTMRNFNGGLIQYFVVTGGTVPILNRRGVKDFKYLKDVYFPVWRDMLGSLKKGEDITTVSKRLYAKGTYSKEQIDDIVEDVIELYGSGLLDTDFLADATNMFKYESNAYGAETIKKGADSLYTAGTETLSARGIHSLFKRVYASGDEMFKALYFSKQKNFYIDKVGLSKKQALELAARDVRRHQPNYKIQPKAFKRLRLTGFGTFMSFTTEITRNTKNIMADSITDVQVGRRLIREGNVKGGRAMIAQGSRRLGTLMAVFAASASGVEMLIDKVDESEDAKRAREAGMQEWQKGGQHYQLEKDQITGNTKYIDLSYINPFNSLARAIPTIFSEANEKINNGADVDEAVTSGFYKAFQNYASPFFARGLVSGPIFGGLFSDKEGAFARSLDTLARNVKPGAADLINDVWNVASKERSQIYNQTGTPMKDLLINTAGIPIQTNNFRDNQKKRYMDLARYGSKAQGSIKSYISRTGLVPDRKEFDFDKEDISVLLNMLSNDGVDSRKIRDDAQIDKFVDIYNEANNERYLVQRQIYSAMLDHAIYLRELKSYQGKNSQNKIFNEIKKVAKEGNLPKSIVNKLARSVALQKEPPRYQPVKYSLSDFKKFRETLENQGLSREEAYAKAREVYSRLDDARKPFRGKSLGFAIREL